MNTERHLNKDQSAVAPLAYRRARLQGPAPMLREGRLRKRFGISGRQWRKQTRIARREGRIEPRVLFSHRFRELAN